MDITEGIDEAIAGLDAVSTSIYILLFAVIVVILVLGLEFWRNLGGMLGSPSLTFQRLIGEVSIPPALFVVVAAGFLMAITFLLAWTDDVTGDAVKAQFNIGFEWMAEQSAETEVLPEDIDFMKWFNNLQRDFATMLTFFVLLPIGCLIIWFLGALGFHISSLLSGNKGGGSMGGLLSASAYIYLVAWMVMLFLIKTIYRTGFAGGFNWFLLGLFAVYFVFLWSLLMREYGRYNYVKGFISFIIGVIITAIFVAVAALAILWIVALLMQWL